MKKHIIAMAVSAAIAAPAAAIADTTLYGKIHASYDFWGGDVVDNADYSLASNSSRLGVKGKEAISDDLSLVYKWEEQVDWGGEGAGIGGARNTFVGFSGNWGTVIFGRHDTPFKGVRGKYDLFGDTIGDARAIVRGRALGSSTNNWDQRYDNQIAYSTPDMGGFGATVAYISDTDTQDLNGDDVLDNRTDAISANASYEVGGFGIIAGYEQHNRAEQANYEDEQTAYRIAAQYKMDGFKVMGLYQGVENVNYLTESQGVALDEFGGDMSMWGVGAAYSFGKSTIKGHYFAASEVDSHADTGADLWAIGYDYKLSKQTTVYVAYAAVSNESGIGDYRVGYKTGHGEDAAVDTSELGNDSNAFSLGVVHKF
ncbi:porin [Guyparkeria halophila]|uniref:Porin n=1 Tax=Guyparkeria halophila TaxID=47960 RepID=A0ABZ0YXB9_9GAMM|nr:porin [Guyparkeria halophila]WQH16810.1 porin [Guyparkeria halophila]